MQKRHKRRAIVVHNMTRFNDTILHNWKWMSVLNILEQSCICL